MPPLFLLSVYHQPGVELAAGVVSYSVSVYMRSSVILCTWACARTHVYVPFVCTFVVLIIMIFFSPFFSFVCMVNAVHDDFSNDPIPPGRSGGLKYNVCELFLCCSSGHTHT